MLAPSRKAISGRPRVLPVSPAIWREAGGYDASAGQRATLPMGRDVAENGDGLRGPSATLPVGREVAENGADRSRRSMKVAGTRRVPSADVMFRSDQRRVQAALRCTGRRADGTRRVPAT